MAKVPELIVLGCGSRGTGYAGFVKNFPEKAKLDEIAKFSNYTISPMVLGADGTLTQEEVKVAAPPKRRFR